MMKKKYTLKKSVKKVIFISAAVILLFVIILFATKQTRYKNSNEYKLLQVGYSENEIKAITDKLSEENIVDLINSEYNKSIINILNSKYYISKNYSKYLGYRKNHINDEISKTIAIINVKADNNWYNNIVKANIDKNELILVNKFYELTEDPQNLKAIPLTYAYDNNFLSELALKNFIEMCTVAKNEGLKLIASTSYRSYENQEKIYNNLLNSNNQAYADKLSARPGHSDHQTGLAVDISAPNVALNEFENTAEFTWLTNNSYKYGFILRYPKDKADITGFDYEAWHYRYVGLKAAQAIYNEDITLDEYYAFYVEK